MRRPGEVSTTIVLTVQATISCTEWLPYVNTLGWGVCVGCMCWGSLALLDRQRQRNNTVKGHKRRSDPNPNPTPTTYKVGLLADEAAVAPEAVRQSPSVPRQLPHGLNFLALDHHRGFQQLHQLRLHSEGCVCVSRVEFHAVFEQEGGQQTRCGDIRACSAEG